MPTMIFANLPVKDLEASKGYFSALGYSFNPQFTDDSAACLVISDTIFAMLLTPASYARFTTKAIADTSKTSEVILALSADSREDVDAIAEKALAAGGTESREADDYGFMYLRAIEDLDGHMWEYMWMDPAQVEG